MMKWGVGEGGEGEEREEGGGSGQRGHSWGGKGMVKLLWTLVDLELKACLPAGLTACASQWCV